MELEGEFLVEPVSILDRRRVELRKKVISQVKVQWQHFRPEEATWEDEQMMRDTYPRLFLNEQLTHWQWIGILLVLSGLLLNIFWPRWLKVRHRQTIKPTDH